MCVSLEHVWLREHAHVGVHTCSGTHQHAHTNTRCREECAAAHTLTETLVQLLKVCMFSDFQHLNVLPLQASGPTIHPTWQK